MRKLELTDVIVRVWLEFCILFNDLIKYKLGLVPYKLVCLCVLPSRGEERRLA